MPPAERFSLPVARAFAALSQAAFCALAALTQGMWSSTIPVKNSLLHGDSVWVFLSKNLPWYLLRNFNGFLVRSYIFVYRFGATLDPISEKTRWCRWDLAELDLRCLSCRWLHTGSWHHTAGTAGDAPCMVLDGHFQVVGTVFFWFFLKGSGMVKSKGTTFFCWVNGGNLPAQRNILQLPSICLVGWHFVWSKG